MISPDIQVVLASTSPRRQELLRSLGVHFEVRPPQTEEDFSPTLTPDKVVEELAYRKASSVVKDVEPNKRNPVIVAGSDTVVVLNGQILGKPASPDEAVEMLSRLNGQRHEVYSGLAVLVVEVQDGGWVVEKKIGHVRTEVWMRCMTQKEMVRYVATGEPLDKAGSYAIQGLGATLVEGIAGDYFTVVGFPVHLFAQSLRELGVSLF